jgi:hypothetical protein
VTDIPFQAGGPLLSNSPTYISRKADEDLKLLLRQMEYVTLIEPRQSGKTSLINQLIGRFSREYAFAYRDLMDDKSSGDSETDWYTSLGTRLLNQLDFISQDQRPNPPVNSRSWEDFLESLARAAQMADRNVVIVLDEVGAMPSAWATSFFSIIRSAYTSRQTQPFWARLTFVIAGVFNPANLIRDPTVSDFNVDHRVTLNDFTLHEVGQLLAHLDLPPDLASSVAKRVYYWTDGQPYLTQRMGLDLSERRDLVATPDINASVDDAVERFFQEDTHHLLRIKSLADDPQLLAYVRQITGQSRTRYTPGLNEKHFRLCNMLGIIKANQDHYCQIRNRIYERALAAIEAEARPRRATKGKRARQAQHQRELQSQWDSITERIAVVQDDLRTTVDREGRHVIQIRLKELENERDQVEAKLDAIEQQLESV